jgi:uncharacterized protein (TIGR02453 family)
MLESGGARGIAIMQERFAGFLSATFRFLRDLRSNNEKQWFELHKPDYQEHVFKPLQALVAGLVPLMLSIDADFDATPALNKTISRIHRDTRFSKDKSPYKTSHWITFKRRSPKWKDFPAYFFEISPDAYRYGMGFYCASRETMDKLRRRMDANPRAFLAATAFYPKQDFLAIEGERYKRPLKGDIPPELNDWYHRKNLYLVSTHQPKGDSIEKTLLGELQRDFETLASFYHYLCKVAAW